jgi:hypothetical protein
MAKQYDQPATEVVANINLSPDLNPVTKAAIDSAVFNAADDEGNVSVTDIQTLAGIENIKPGTDVITVDSGIFAEAGEDITIDAPVVIFSGDVPVNFTPQPGQVIVSGEGDDKFVMIDGVVSPAALGVTKGLVSAQAENDVPGINIDGAGGNDSIESASGNDTISGGAGDDSISSGAGNDSISAGTGNDSVDGGTGWDQVVMDNGGGADNYEFEVVDGVVTVRDISTGELTETSNAEYVNLGDGAAIINAADTEDGTAARQSEAILGEQMTSEELEAYNLEVDQVGLDQASTNLMDSSGFAAATADLTDAEYINLLYNQTFGRDVDAEGAAFYAQQLADDVIDRGKLAADLGWSDEGIVSNDLVNEIDGLV